MNGDHMLKAIDGLYAAALGDEEWSLVLTRFANILGCVAATSEIHHIDDHSVVHIESVGLDLADAARYMEDFNYNPRSDFLHKSRTGLIGHDYLLISDAQMDFDPFYQELLTPLGLRYFISAQTPLMDSKFIATLSFQRRQRDGAATDEQLATLRYLEPTIKRALSLWWSRVRDQVDPERFTRLLASLGLTPAESQLAKALTLGEPLSDYAKRNGRSLNTVHTHYRRLKDKLDCASQASLLARLHTLKSKGSE